MNFLKNKVYVYFYYFLFIIGIIIVGLSIPIINWDIIGYVGSAYHLEYSSITEIHKNVYNGLRDFISAEKYFALTEGGEYIKNLANNPYFFMQNLPFYEIRPIYVGLIYILNKLGLNIFASTYYISIFFTVASIMLLFKTFLRKINIELLYIIPLFLMSYGVLELGRLSTPDSLAFFGISIFIYLHINSKENWIFFLLPILILIRTDLIIFNVIYLIYHLLNHKKSYIKILACFVTSIIIYFFINSFIGNYGWSTVFKHTFIAKISNPADVQSVVLLKDYISVLLKGIVSAMDDGIFLNYLTVFLINVLLLMRLNPNFLKIEIIKSFIIVSFIYILAHFLLFPVTWQRFFVGFYLMNALATILIIDGYLKKINYED